MVISPYLNTPQRCGTYYLRRDLSHLNSSERRKFHLHVSTLILLFSAKLQVYSLNDSFQLFKSAPMSFLLPLTQGYIFSTSPYVMTVSKQQLFLM